MTAKERCHETLLFGKPDKVPFEPGGPREKTIKRWQDDAMTREFLLPSWSRWICEARQAGVKIFDMDSDGRVDELIPVWIEAGFNVCDPVEVAAGCDINALRRQFGRKMAYRQGVDKRCMAKGGRVIEAEMARIAPVISDGGYIPGCDHGIPFDISWQDFIHFGKLLAELTGWL